MFNLLFWFPSLRASPKRKTSRHNNAALNSMPHDATILTRSLSDELNLLRFTALFIKAIALLLHHDSHLIAGGKSLVVRSWAVTGSRPASCGPIAWTVWTAPIPLSSWLASARSPTSCSRSACCPSRASISTPIPQGDHQ